MSDIQIFVEDLKKQLAAKDARIAELVEFLKRCANDEFCDNDGRGCGSGFHAQDLLDKYAALAGEAQ